MNGWLRTLRHRLNRRPDLAIAINDLGVQLAQRGLLEEARRAFDAAAQTDPLKSEIWSNLGAALNALGRCDEALRAFEEAARFPDVAARSFDNWGHALSKLDRCSEAAEKHREAIQRDPSLATAYAHLGSCLRAMGRIDEAYSAYEKALQLDPNDTFNASNHLFALNYNHWLTVDEIAAAHRAWPGAQIERPAMHRVTRDPDRKLRIGYVSPDMRLHACANFLLPVLQTHDRSQVVIHGYAHVENPDEVTSVFRSACDAFVNVAQLDDASVARRIADDGIDILIDCAGHTADNRLGAFVFRPAPVQGSWLGYPNTTGLRSMDFRLTDAVTDPAGSERLFVERLVRLPFGHHTYRPVVGSADPAMPKSGEPIVFAAVHNRSKIDSRAIALWSRVIKAVPDSRLVVKCKGVSDPPVHESLLDAFAAEGIMPAFVDLRPPRPDYGRHFEDFHQFHIILDATLYNGTTTTCEALWMGVPVVTLPGDRTCRRVGASLLTQIGHPEWIAKDEDEFVRIAAELAADQPRLADIRRTLRGDMLASPLGDARQFTAGLESAYRDLWKEWCATAP